ncbi:MAG: hypothetical protein ABSF70_00920 [Terracidiphilus sp.]
MTTVRKLACIMFVLGLLQHAFAQEQQVKDDVRWCPTIRSFPVLQEARFSAVYVFDLNAHGCPVNIRRANVPFISKADRTLIACIADWHLPKSKSKGTAVFSFQWGWKSLQVTAGDFAVTVPAQPPNSDSH